MTSGPSPTALRRIPDRREDHDGGRPRSPGAGTSPPPRAEAAPPGVVLAGQLRPLVLLLILVTYALSAAITATWAVSLVLFVQIATIWVALQASQANRHLRRVTGAILIVTAIAAILNLFISRETTGGFMAVISGLLYAVAPVIIVRRLVLRRTVDTQTVLGAIAAYLMVGMGFRSPTGRSARCRPARSWVAREGPLPPVPVLLVHHPDHDRVRQPGPGRQPRADPRRPGDADRAAIPGDGGGQSGQRLATRPGPRPLSTEPDSN